MTVRINFLPRNYQPPAQWGGREYGIVAAAVVALLGTGAYYGSVYVGTNNMVAQAERDTAQLKTVQAQLAEATEIKAREQRVAEAEREMKALTGRHWSGVLLTLSDLTPQHLAWTSLKTSGNDVVLKGTSRGLVDMAQLLGGLVTERSVERVTLKYINEQGIPVIVSVKPGEKVDGKLLEGGSGSTGGDKSGAAGGPGAVPEGGTKQVGVVRQLEFELTITLVPAEGRPMPSGA